MTSQASTGSVREYIYIGSNFHFVYIIHSATVSGVSSVALSSTAVRVSWTPVNLTVVDYYTVHYTTVGSVNGTITFPASENSTDVQNFIKLCASVECSRCGFVKFCTSVAVAYLGFGSGGSSFKIH